MRSWKIVFAATAVAVIFAAFVDNRCNFSGNRLYIQASVHLVNLAVAGNKKRRSLSYEIDLPVLDLGSG